MNQSVNPNIDLFRSPPHLLITESADEFALLRDGLYEEIQPKGIIEQTYVDDLAVIIWETLRVRRYRTIIINSAYREALQGILETLLFRDDFEDAFEHEKAAEKLAYGWFEDKKARAQVSKILRAFGLDEGSIEAEAFRRRAEDLDRMDRMLTVLEVRRERILRFIGEYRHSLSAQLRQCTDSILEREDVPRLVQRSG